MLLFVLRRVRYSVRKTIGQFRRERSAFAFWAYVYVSHELLLHSACVAESCLAGVSMSQPFSPVTGEAGWGFQRYRNVSITRRSFRSPPPDEFRFLFRTASSCLG